MSCIVIGSIQEWYLRERRGEERGVYKAPTWHVFLVPDFPFFLFKGIVTAMVKELHAK